MSRLTRPLWIVVALLFLLEAWIWDHVGPWIAKLVQALPFQNLKKNLEERLATLSPYATLAVLALATTILAPVKIIEVWLVAHHHYVATVLLFIVAKTVGVGLTAFLFRICKPKLLMIPWFVKLYEATLRARRWAEIQVHPIMERIRALKADLVAKLPKRLALRRARRLRQKMARQASANAQ